MKKLISILLLLLIFAFVVSCDNTPVETGSNNNSEVVTDTQIDTNTDTSKPTDTETNTDTEDSADGENLNDILGPDWTLPQK